MTVKIKQGRIDYTHVYFAEVDAPRTIEARGFTEMDALWELYKQAGDELRYIQESIIKKMIAHTKET